MAELLKHCVMHASILVPQHLSIMYSSSVEWFERCIPDVSRDIPCCFECGETYVPDASIISNRSARFSISSVCCVVVVVVSGGRQRYEG